MVRKFLQYLSAFCDYHYDALLRDLLLSLELKWWINWSIKAAIENKRAGKQINRKNKCSIEQIRINERLQELLTFQKQLK